MADSGTTYRLSASSFHEMPPYLTIVTAWDLVDFGRAKERFADLDSAPK